ncbi:hypothetical protein N9D31_04105, partial [Oligoflexaceae bacterium]|nr:hypothetical protein [Oligoflexaceae bacterium]
ARFGNWLQVNLIVLFCKHRFKDMGPLRAMRLQNFVFLNMRDPTWAWNIEMQVKAAYHKLRIREILIEYLPRRFGHSKISGSVTGSIRAGSRIIWGVVYYFFDARRQR